MSCPMTAVVEVPLLINNAFLAINVGLSVAVEVLSRNLKIIITLPITTKSLKLLFGLFRLLFSQSFLSVVGFIYQLLSTSTY